MYPLRIYLYERRIVSTDDFVEIARYGRGSRAGGAWGASLRPGLEGETSRGRLQALDRTAFSPYATAASINLATPQRRTAQLHPGRKCPGRDRSGRLVLL